MTEQIPREALHHPEAFTLLYLAFGRGAETITAKTLNRLTDANTAIWIGA